MLWVSSCCTLLSASNLIWLLATAEQTWRAWAWDATSNHILRWGSLWGTGHVLRDVMMIVPSKEPSVRALLKKHYVFYYSALSEIWIWKTLLRQSDISNWGSFFFAVCWLTVSSGDSWNWNSSWSGNSAESLQKMFLRYQGIE